MLDGLANVRLLLDENLSPKVAERLRNEDGLDVVHLRDRDFLQARDHQVLDYAFNQDYILVTANVNDFLQLAHASELHPGIVLLCDGELRRDEQLTVVRNAVDIIRAKGLDMINRVLKIGADGSYVIEEIPSAR